MTSWAVFIYCTAPGYQCHWVDSQWAIEKSALDRRDDLNGYLKVFQSSNHMAQVHKLKVADTAIAEVQK